MYELHSSVVWLEVCYLQDACLEGAFALPATRLAAPSWRNGYDTWMAPTLAQASSSSCCLRNDEGDRVANRSQLSLNACMPVTVCAYQCAWRSPGEACLRKPAQLAAIAGAHCSPASTVTTCCIYCRQVVTLISERHVIPVVWVTSTHPATQTITTFT